MIVASESIMKKSNKSQQYHVKPNHNFAQPLPHMGKKDHDYTRQYKERDPNRQPKLQTSNSYNNLAYPYQSDVKPNFNDAKPNHDIQPPNFRSSLQNLSDQNGGKNQQHVSRSQTKETRGRSHQRRHHTPTVEHNSALPYPVLVEAKKPKTVPNLPPGNSGIGLFS